MYVLGLTGSMGMGKSTTAVMFRQHNIPVYDADDMVHQLYQTSAIRPVQEILPHVIENSQINRDKLKQHLAEHPGDLQKIEAIIHPLVRKAQLNWMNIQAMKAERLVVLDIPLLFETGGEKLCDAVIVVTTDEKTQIKRIMQRRKMTLSEVDILLSRQMSDAEKRAKADYIIDTSISLEDAASQVIDLLKKSADFVPSHRWKEAV